MGGKKKRQQQFFPCITIHFHTYTITLFVITAIVWPLGDILFFLFILKNDLCSFITWIDCSLNFNKADKNDIIFFVLFLNFYILFFHQFLNVSMLAVLFICNEINFFLIRIDFNSLVCHKFLAYHWSYERNLLMICIEKRRRRRRKHIIDR